LVYFNFDESNFIKKEDAEDYSYIGIMDEKSYTKLAISAPDDGFDFQFVEWNDDVHFGDNLTEGTLEN
jgi:hypothetical protein